MTIEEAISHAEDVACRKCDECAMEHRQLANWLKELVGARRRLKIAEDALKNSPCGEVYQLGIVDDDGNCYNGVVLTWLTMRPSPLKMRPCAKLRKNSPTAHTTSGGQINRNAGRHFVGSGMRLPG